MADNLNESLPFQPVVIIGAARSGTNALRDMLVQLPGVATWPCDEINPIWRHGNIRHPDDELPDTAARDDVRRFVRGAFRNIWKAQGRPDIVIEKTCANSLRVPFVAAVLPEAKFIYIVRDGVAVVASARKRWRGELEVRGLPYFLAKARYAPLSDLPFYAGSVLARRISIRLGLKEHMGVWGPRFADMGRFAHEPVEALCARQWQACIDSSDAAFATMAEDRLFTLSYEALTADPLAMLDRLTGFLGMEASAEARSAAAGKIRRGGAGKRPSDLPDMDRVMEILDAPMRRHGYI
ncbi:sulfotransferase [Roseovarius sp. MBR-6]|jgi:hypothetical protein|uniref:sulfotransferase family protein n=1 Tax=Roseovarius sp. MBR-6 TaxID=3156459 RepID=UPI003394C5AA